MVMKSQMGKETSNKTPPPTLTICTRVFVFGEMSPDFSKVELCDSIKTGGSPTGVAAIFERKGAGMHPQTTTSLLGLRVFIPSDSLVLLMPPLQTTGFQSFYLTLGPRSIALSCIQYHTLLAYTNALGENRMKLKIVLIGQSAKVGVECAVDGEFLPWLIIRLYNISAF